MLMYLHVSFSSEQYCVDYLNGDVGLSVLSRLSRLRTSSRFTVQAILDTPQRLVCIKQPAHIDVNCTLVVDTTKLQDPGVARSILLFLMMVM